MSIKDFDKKGKSYDHKQRFNVNFLTFVVVV